METNKISYDNLPAAVAELHRKMDQILAEKSEPKKAETKYYTRIQLKEKLSIGSDNTVIRLEKEGVLKPIRIGRKLLYSSENIENISGLE